MNQQIEIIYARDYYSMKQFLGDDIDNYEITGGGSGMPFVFPLNGGKCPSIFQTQVTN